MNAYAPALEGEQPPASSRNGDHSQQLSANVWQEMRGERPFAAGAANNAHGMDTPRGSGQLFFSHGEALWGKEKAPLGDRTNFNEPFDQGKANALIQQMGSAKYAEREAAEAKITQMGEKALPMLENTRNRTRDLEVQTRSQAAINAINDGLDRNRSIDARRTLRNNDVEWDQLADHAGKSQLKDQDKSVPTKDEQRRFDKMIKELDSLPHLNSTLAHAQEKASRPGASQQDRADTQELADANRAKESAKLKYAQALSVSKDPADIKKGQDLLTDYLNKSDSKLSDEDARSINSLAQSLDADSNPDLLKALRTRIGTTGATK